MKTAAVDMTLAKDKDERSLPSRFMARRYLLALRPDLDRRRRPP
jgi:hypothetical protein